MKDLVNLLSKNAIDYGKLSKFGFKKIKNEYVYKEQIINGEFEVQIYISDQKKYSKVIDIENDIEYALVDVEDAVGEFVGNVRSEYENIINKFVKSCTHKEVFKAEQSKEIIEYVSQKYGDELEFLWEKFDDNAIWRNKKNNKWYAALLTITEDKLGMKSNKKIEIIDLRYQKDKIDELVDFNKFYPGYHMNKKSWITIKLDSSVETNEIFDFIDNSYDISIEKKSTGNEGELSQKVLDYLTTIPKGKVVTYKQVAEHIGNKGLARAVGNALHKNPDGDKYPCYKVLNSKGELVEAFVFGGKNVQKERLEKDGIEVVDGKVDLKKYQWEE